MQLALIISFAVLFNLCCCEKLSVCKTILVKTGEAGDVKKTCEGQTVFVNQQGPKGEKGEMGPKGEKGDSASSKSIKSLQDQIIEIRQSLNNYDKNILAKIDPGWYNGLNGYQYKITKTAQSYAASRKACQREGGDLAVVGAKDKKVVVAALKHFKYKHQTYIGLNDIKKEGNFVWLDGTRGSLRWPKGEPSGGRRENCGRVYPSGLFNDVPCNHRSRALCEKKLNA